MQMILILVAVVSVAVAGGQQYLSLPIISKES